MNDAFQRRKIGHSAQLGLIQPLTLRGGTGDGRRLIAVENGCLSFTLTEDAALDILTLRYRGQNIGFLSKNGLQGNGALRESADFSSVFPGGFLYTCGLDAVGDREGHPTHGRLHALPMKLLSLRDGSGESGETMGRMEILGTTRQTALFGENLRFTRRITTELGSASLCVEDTVTNDGFVPSPFCLLYHVNFGYPFLDAETCLTAETISSVGRTSFAATRLSAAFQMEQSSDGMEEQVFYHRTADGKVSVENRLSGLTVDLRFDKEAMPWFLQWKSRGSGDYALGIEPSTTRLDGAFEEQILLPGESRRFFVEWTFRERAR